jgi:lipid-A-disaccharide synthase
MRIFISTGEVSGDLQGAMLVQSLYHQAHSEGINIEIVGLGGEGMQEAGMKLVANTTAIGSVGLLESLPFILPTWQIQQQVKKYLQVNPVDAVVLIDYVGPNLAIGSYLKKKLPHLPIIWYIGPQYWVWTPLEQNVRQLVNITDQLLAIFPEEAKFYRKKGLSVTYVGHPLLDRMKKAPTRDEARAKLGIKSQDRVIALLPASRQQEIKYLLPVIAKSAQKIQQTLTDVHFYIPLSLPTYRNAIEKAIEDYHLKATIMEGKTLEVIASADLAITKSGTVNLELALLKIPQVVIYKVNPLTIWFARNILKFSIPFMSPANLVLMSEVVPELLQEKATVENIVTQSLELLLNPKRRHQLDLDYQNICQALGENERGICDRTAQEIIKTVVETK